MKKILFALISFMLITVACTTDIRVQGFVGTSNGWAIENASVIIQKSQKILETTTDRGGYYKFDNVPRGTWTITVSKEGYETQVETFSVSGGSSGNIHQRMFVLKPLPIPK